jgi:hypothetical protein
LITKGTRQSASRMESSTSETHQKHPGMGNRVRRGWRILACNSRGADLVILERLCGMDLEGRLPGMILFAAFVLSCWWCSISGLCNFARVERYGLSLCVTLKKPSLWETCADSNFDRDCCKCHVEGDRCSHYRDV